MGLRVVLQGEMALVLKEFCGRIMANSLATSRLTRYAIYSAYDMEFGKAFDWVNDIYTGGVMQTEDFRF